MRKRYNGGSIHAYLCINHNHPYYLTVRIHRGLGSVFKDVQRNLRKVHPTAHLRRTGALLWLAGLLY